MRRSELFNVIEGILLYNPLLIYNLLRQSRLQDRTRAPFSTGQITSQLLGDQRLFS